MPAPPPRHNTAYPLDAVHGVLREDLEKRVGTELALQDAEALIHGILKDQLAQLAAKLRR